MPTQHVSIKGVVKQARVGIITVSRVLNGQGGVSDKTRQHIQDIVDSLGCRPNRHARFLKPSLNHSIVMVIKSLDSPLFVKILEQMEREIRAREYLTSIVSIPHWSDKLSEAMKIMNGESVSEVMFLDAQYEHRTVNIEKLQVPFVVSTISWMDNAYRERCASVSIDSRGEAGRVIDYPYGLGHRHVALLGSGSLDNSIDSLRLPGYLEAMRRLGLELQPGQVRSFDTIADEPYSFESGYKITRDLLAQCPEVTAIFAVADVLAIGALRATHESGHGVPQDLSIVGFDGVPVGKSVYPSLTTIEQSVEKIVEVTCGMLFSRLAGDSPQHTIVPGSLVERGSVIRVSPRKS